MSKYIIHCSTTRSYWLTVEAPNKEAVYSYYEGSDGDKFNAGDEDGWTFHEIEDVTGLSHPSTDIVVDDSGEVLLKETLDKNKED